MVREEVGSGNRKASDSEILEAYDETHNIWKAGERLGMSGQSIWKRLKRLGVHFDQRIFSDDEKEYLFKHYDDCVSNGRLDELSEVMGRTKYFLCRQAGKLGLTDQHRKHTAECVEGRIANLKLWYRIHDHPRGFLGGTHTDETKKIISQASIKAASKKTEEDWRRRGEKAAETRSKNGTTSVTYNTYSRCKGGYRQDIGIYVRSRWEANYCRYLNFLIEKGELYKWEYEVDTFRFHGVTIGVQAYTPDFKVWDDEYSEPYYIEVKGYMDEKSKVRLERMRKHYPNIRLVLVASNEYYKIRKAFGGLIDGWEND